MGRSSQTNPKLRSVRASSKTLICLPIIAAASLGQATPHTFQPGELISADRMNENFSAVEASGAMPGGLISAGRGEIEFIVNSESLFGLACPGNFVTRTTSDFLLIPGVCDGDCGLQQITESCGDYEFYGESVNIDPMNLRDNEVPPRLGIKDAVKASMKSMICQRVSDTSDPCRPGNWAWNIVKPAFEVKKISVTLRQRIKMEVGLGFVGNTYPISYEYELKEFVDPYPALTVEINDKQVVFSNYPYQNVVQTRSYGGLCGSTTSKDITLSDCRLTFYSEGVPPTISSSQTN